MYTVSILFETYRIFHFTLLIFPAGRTRQWFSVQEAAQKLSHKPVQVSYLDLLKKEQDMVT